MQVLTIMLLRSNTSSLRASLLRGGEKLQDHQPDASSRQGRTLLHVLPQVCACKTYYFRLVIVHQGSPMQAPYQIAYFAIGVVTSRSSKFKLIIVYSYLNGTTGDVVRHDVSPALCCNHCCMAKHLWAKF